jgi:uncharacterized protein (DUF2267 family)
MSTIKFDSINVATKALEQVFKRKAEILAGRIAVKAQAELRKGLQDLAAESALEIATWVVRANSDTSNIEFVFKEK